MSVRWCPSPARNSETGPKHMRWTIQSRYAAAKIITNVIVTPTHGLKANAPWKTRNSPTNPARPGSPTDAKTKNPKAAE